MGSVAADVSYVSVLLRNEHSIFIVYIPVLLRFMYHFMIVDQSGIALLTCLYVHIMYNCMCTILIASSTSAVLSELTNVNGRSSRTP